MTLPSTFNALTPAQQLFVITDIERVDRGLPPLVGLVDTFNTDAQAGALALNDPEPTQIPAGLHLVAWGSNWAENVNPLGSNYFWMYDDGLNSGNVDCTDQPVRLLGASRELLSLTSYQHQYGGTLLMGAAETTGNTGNGYESDTELLVLATGPVPALSYTWQQAVAAGRGRSTIGARPLPPGLGAAISDDPASAGIAVDVPCPPGRSGPSRPLVHRERGAVNTSGRAEAATDRPVL